MSDDDVRLWAEMMLGALGGTVEFEGSLADSLEAYVQTLRRVNELLDPLPTGDLGESLAAAAAHTSWVQHMLQGWATDLRENRDDLRNMGLEAQQVLYRVDGTPK